MSLLFRFSHRLWRLLFPSRSALSLRIFSLVCSSALLLAVVCGGVARADDGIEVIEQETPKQEIVSEVEDNNAKEEEKQDETGPNQPEQVKDTKAAEVMEEERKEQPMEDYTADIGAPIGNTKAGLNLTAYGNVSPTNQYALYATGLLKEVPYDGHYVFLQDTSQSYVMVAGKGDSISSLSDCRWWRWYNAGVNVGWVLESGGGSVSVSAGRYTVLSDFEDWPALQQNSDEVLRREVSLYALVAAIMHVLYCIWSYQLRGAKRSIS